MIIRQYDFNVSTATDDAPVATGAFHIPAGTTAQRPTGAAGLIRHNTTTQQFEGHNGIDWGDIGGGSGAGSRNYLDDWFDGAKSVGTVTNSITATGNITASAVWKASDTTKLTVANAATGGLRETKSLKLDHIAVGAGFVQTPEFVLDTMDLGKPVSVSFDHGTVTAADDYQVYMVRYNSSGTYQEQIAIAGTASATSPFSARLSASSVVKFQGFFIAGSTSTDLYALRFYRNNAADTTDVLLDSLYVGPNQVVQGAAITDWKTPTTGSVLKYNTTTATNIDANYPKTKIRQVGDSLDMRVVVAFSGAANANGNFKITLPDSLTVDTTKEHDSGYMYFTSVALYTNSKMYTGTAYVNSSDNTISIQAADGAGATATHWAGNTTAGSNTPSGAAIGSSDYMTVEIHGIPITGWSSNVTMANRAVEEYAYNSSATWDTDDTTSFGYGLTGGTISGGLSAGGRTKRVRFQSPALATDNVELKLTDGTVYIPALQFADTSNNRVVNSKMADGTNVGFLVKRVSGSSTDFDVFFHQYAAAANDDSPAQNWINGWKWVLVKTSGGAAVGYPISSENIVIPHNSTNYTGFSSGTYTPTITNGTNVAASANVAAFYQRIGNIVYVSGAVNIDPTAANTFTDFQLSFPITRTAITYFATFGTSYVATEPSYWGAATSSATVAVFRGYPNSVSNQTVAFSFMYNIA